MKKCTSCGGSLIFNPSTGNLYCLNCGNQKEIKQNQNFLVHKFDMNVELDETDTVPKVLGSHCPSCGAVFEGNKYTISDICEYCGANLVADFSLTSKSSPDACIPFAFDKEIAKQKFKQGLKKKWFLPNKLKSGAFKNNIESVYVPAYLMNIQSENQYYGRLYTKSRRSDGSTKTYYKNIAGVENIITRNITIECSSAINQLTFDNIKPFDFSSLVKFNSDYLLGYSVEYFDKKIEDVKSLVKEIVASDVRKTILRGYVYDGIDYLHINTKYTNSEYSKIILPTYKVSYKYKNKQYVTYMNGQTGKVGGNLPRSALKIFMFVLGIVIGVGALLYILLS